MTAIRLRAGGTPPESSWMPRSLRAGCTPLAVSHTTTRGGAASPPRPMTVTPRSMTANAAHSPLIDSVYDEKDRLCGASSWSLHTNRRHVDDNENNVVARGDDNGRRHPPPPRADADEDSFSTRTATAATLIVPLRAPMRTIGADSGRATTRRRAGGGRRSARIGAVGRQRWLAVARAGGGQRDERLKTAGGGGGRSEDVGSNVAAPGAGSRRREASSRRTMQQHGGADDNGKPRERAADNGAAA